MAAITEKSKDHEISDRVPTTQLVTGRMVLVVLACWMVIGALYLSSVVLNAQKFGQPFELSARVVAGNQATYLCWALFNVLMIGVMRQLSGKPAATWYLVLAGLIGLAWIPVNLWLDASIGDWTFQRGNRSAAEIFSQTNFFSVFFVVMLYLTVLFSSLGWAFVERWQATREKALRLQRQMVAGELEMADLRMQVLKAQLSPHFLFNALGSISGLIRSAPEGQANTAIQTLGDMLRYTLSTDDESLIHFDSELQFTEDYLALQRLRFGDRFTLAMDTDSVPAAATCPPFVLQTLVENAFVHGVEQRDQPTEIEVAVWVSDHRLSLKVSNSVADTAVPAGGAGLALQNLKRRLELLFADEATVVGKVDAGVYVATVTLPLVSSLS